ncbi:hypothetical protein [Chitinilyticum piscinae]|uniref:Uncharacterized protein n=1 Tax=Chitinilyticum piscinae TaxID=2866724 RepID=A0A8J7FLV7_9NEIS|nr:hypothetical protein [Chitinilyticum piscinae]MBE9610287.1 hypothetical protein [Chitinilyticum piscinae]
MNRSQTATQAKHRSHPTGLPAWTSPGRVFQQIRDTLLPQPARTRSRVERAD